MCFREYNSHQKSLASFQNYYPKLDISETAKRTYNSEETFLLPHSRSLKGPLSSSHVVPMPNFQNWLNGKENGQRRHYASTFQAVCYGNHTKQTFGNYLAISRNMLNAWKIVVTQEDQRYTAYIGQKDMESLRQLTQFLFTPNIKLIGKNKKRKIANRRSSMSVPDLTTEG